MSQSVSCGNRRFALETLTRWTATQAVLDAGAADLLALFLQREREFGFDPAVVVEYPDIARPASSLFLKDPVAVIQSNCTALARLGRDISRIVVLTTFADRLADPFAHAGYAARAIDMPAGPDHLGVFTRQLPEVGDGAGTLYVEAVNEADEKIRPAFVLRLLDEQGGLAGGVCGAIHDRRGRRYAYVATMAVRAGLPAATGTKLAAVLRIFLRAQGVGTVHLGTQTADRFYEKAGFRVTHRLIPALRTRYTRDDRLVTHDLVMMAMDL